MVQAMIDIPERTNRVLNMVKAQFGLKTKSEAIARVVEDLEDSYLDKPLKPEFIAKMNRLQKHGKYKAYSSWEDVEKELENEEVHN